VEEDQDLQVLQVQQVAVQAVVQVVVVPALQVQVAVVLLVHLVVEKEEGVVREVRDLVVDQAAQPHLDQAPQPRLDQVEAVADLLEKEKVKVPKKVNPKEEREPNLKLLWLLQLSNMNTMLHRIFTCMSLVSESY